MIKGYHSNIMKIYESIRTAEENSLKSRREEINKKLPQVLELEREIGKLSVHLSISILNSNLKNKDEYLKGIKEKIVDLRVKKSELLVSNHYPIDYLEMNYRCTKCKDTGFIETKKCTCYKQKLVELYYDNSELKTILRKSNFDNFNFELYSSRRNENEHISPRKNIEEIVYNVSWRFIENFSSSNENLLFYGNPGTGKSFLSNCIAKEILDRGFLVVYRTADSLIQDLRRVRFDNDTGLEDLLINCDLLIIDDLGSEQITDFSKTELFNLLNRRLLKGNKMLVSTNCNLEEILKLYSERISSRLLGEFTLCKFLGEDIRIYQNIKNKKY
ncbi:ATP-binding protein [Clostridium sp. CX1]|uniref:ATP-binding protein n=1 Tax=Clostridium tanneri TaxID=3037988 RepID=A0ABU4JU05_9CLOT|nr:MULTISPECIES: ATP-binding protein [unclassified Clostridium]MCT8977579.1 ATP-binding protein [Clostridium sp. CX1]MDW8801582.1 ATP-binding protein [Clostridium sp. A1-XYC3]